MGAESDPKDAAHALVGTVLADRYRVDRFLGAGGMGAVYLGEHVLMRKAVAIKVLHREMTGLGEVVARFEREAVAAGRIDHRNVAAASDFGRLDDGSFYLVLEYVDGQSLSALVDEKPIELHRALGIAEQVASALVAAHDAGVVHRDLKPDNVMLVRGPEGQDLVKVLDFGIAKVDNASDAPATGHKLTRIGAIMGTAGYMAPEQALGQAVDHRADLYALGVLLYEMLSGRPPFAAEELSQIVAKQLTEKPPPLPAGTPPELSDLVDRLLRTAPGERPESAAKVKAELGRLRASGSRTDIIARAMTVAVTTATPPESEPGGASRPRSRSGLAIAAVIAAALLGAGFAWRAASGSPAPATSAASAEPPASLATGVVPEQAPLPSASAAPVPHAVETGKSVAPVAAPTARTQTTVSHSRTTSPDGHTVTTKTTKRTTSTGGTAEQKSTHRRTGPGGIYIPPPSQWFK